MKKIILSLVLCLTFFLKANAGDSIFTDHVYSSDIKTIQFGLSGATLSVPILTLDGSTQLQLSFDDLSGKDRNFFYTIQQCTANWTASELSSFDYLSGFNDDQIRDNQYSFNTLQSFTHYQLTLPNDDISITKSGNYIIKVFIDDDTSQVVFVRRFMVVDQKTKISGRIVQPEDANHSDTYQQVNFSITYQNLTVNDPFNELYVVVQQNNRFDNEVTGVKPQFVQSNKLDYEYMPQLLFPGGKEFRYFDIQSLIYKGYHVDELDDSDNQYFIKLSYDQPRTYEQYSFSKDINGKFLVNIMNSTHPDEEADYTNVQFRLKMDYPLLGGKIYVVGELTDWQALPEYCMTYDFDKHVYIANVYLKQGYYNYAYAYVEHEKTNLNLSELEGDSYETENDYTIFVYYHPFGARYDQLVGVQTINSLAQNTIENNKNNKGNNNNGSNGH